MGFNKRKMEDERRAAAEKEAAARRAIATSSVWAEAKGILEHEVLEARTNSGQIRTRARIRILALGTSRLSTTTPMVRSGKACSGQSERRSRGRPNALSAKQAGR
jgi:hypothetical protein